MLKKQLQRTSLREQLLEVLNPLTVESFVTQFNENLYTRTSLTVESVNALINGEKFPFDTTTFSLDLACLFDVPDDFAELTSTANFWHHLCKAAAKKNN